MSNLKRSRTTEWGSEINLPPDKRVAYSYESENHHGGYGVQNESQIWPETHENSYVYQNTASKSMPAADPFSDHSSPSLPNVCQGQQGFNNKLYQAREAELSRSSSAPTGENAMEGVIFTNPNNDLPVESLVGTPEIALKTIDVCFGTLCDVKVQLDQSLDSECLDREGLNFREIVTETQTFLTLQLLFSEENCVLQTKQKRTFGVLNNKVFRSLTKLSCFQALEYVALIGFNGWKERSFSTGKDSKISCISLDINISGPRSELDTIARELSRARLFLQSPHHSTTTLPYENPQYLHLLGVVQVQEFPVSSSSQEPNFPTSVISAPEQVVVLNDEYPDFDKILEELPRHDYLKEAVVDIRVKTQLLRHQKEAVDFVIRRETLSSHESRCLWENHNSSENFQGYQHVITGSKSPTPEDFRGGILADDMGLGKSLAMLSTILRSLNRANEYAGQVFSVEGHGPCAAKSTLIITPSALLLDSWIEEIDKHIFRGTLTYCKYHGQDRSKDPSTLAQYDVILTTYGTVVADFSRSRNVLDRIKWYRLIVDEAHVIRNLLTKQFQAVNKIPSHIRWCLTGTPIQNSLADLGSLVAFLGMPILQEPAIFRKYIDGMSHRSKAGPKNDFTNLRLLLGSICLRRSKAILSLFGLTMEERRPRFSTLEREEYNVLLQKSRIALDLALSGHNTKETHQRVIEALLRLRLFCNNGSVQEKDGQSTSCGDPEETLSLLEQSGEAVCKYCCCDILSIGISESPDFVHMTECRRLICRECIPQYHQELKKAETDSKQPCPFCSQKHGEDNLLRKETGYIGAGSASTKQYPSKLIALLEDIHKNPLQEKRYWPVPEFSLAALIAHNQDSIVFSFWKKSLDLVGNLFNANGIQYCRVDGSLSLGKRKAVLSEFQGNLEVRVLIMTLGTGAVGLNNLSIANRIYLLEPQWNPSVESQAIGRIFRLGQERPVTVIRYIMDGTIEENVKSKQLRKIRLASGGFDAKSSAQRVEQLQQLKAIMLDT